MMVMGMMFMVDGDGYDDDNNINNSLLVILTVGTIVCGEANQDYTLQHYSTNYLSIHLRQSYVLPVVLLYAELQ